MSSVRASGFGRRSVGDARCAESPWTLKISSVDVAFGHTASDEPTAVGLGRLAPRPPAVREGAGGQGGAVLPVSSWPPPQHRPGGKLQAPGGRREHSERGGRCIVHRDTDERLCASRTSSEWSASGPDPDRRSAQRMRAQRWVLDHGSGVLPDRGVTTRSLRSRLRASSPPPPGQSDPASRSAPGPCARRAWETT